jgi:FkbM family methyltransferase
VTSQKEKSLSPNPMKRLILDVVKNFIPYKSLPPSLKKIVSGIAYTSKARNTSATSNTGNVLNCLIAYNELGGYCTPISSNQRPVVQQILKGRVHESDTIAFIRKHCGSGDVVHAGTFFGDFLPGISAGMSTNAKVWAFEPNLENFRCAQITLLLNGIENVILKNAGLGETVSVQKMLIQTQDGINLGGASKIVNDTGNGKSIDINIVSIDKTIPTDRHVSVIQLDVEGYEKEALAGALETIKRCKPILILEIEEKTDVTKTDWFSENIFSLGYEVTGRVHMNAVVQYKGMTKPHQH